jgi:hypothetical protein
MYPICKHVSHRDILLCEKFLPLPLSEIHAEEAFTVTCTISLPFLRKYPKRLVSHGQLYGLRRTIQILCLEEIENQIKEYFLCSTVYAFNISWSDFIPSNGEYMFRIRVKEIEREARFLVCEIWIIKEGQDLAEGVLKVYVCND